MQKEYNQLQYNILKVFNNIMRSCVQCKVLEMAKKLVSYNQGYNNKMLLTLINVKEL